MKYDKEEKTIVDAYEKDIMVLSKPSKKEIEAIKATARKKFLVEHRCCKSIDISFRIRSGISPHQCHGREFLLKYCRIW